MAAHAARAGAAPSPTKGIVQVSCAVPTRVLHRNGARRPASIYSCNFAIDSLGAMTIHGLRGAVDEEPDRRATNPPCSDRPKGSRRPRAARSTSVQCVLTRATLDSSAAQIVQLLGWSTAAVHEMHSRWAEQGEAIFDVGGRGGRRHQDLAPEQGEGSAGVVRRASQGRIGLDRVSVAGAPRLAPVGAAPRAGEAPASTPGPPAKELLPRGTPRGLAPG